MITDIWEGARLQSGWCILRTAPASTMNLAKTLGEAGFTAWTPVEAQTRKRPRSSVTVERTVPMLPSFVFADASNLRRLATLALMVEKRQPAFSVFRSAGRIPIITEASLAHLRQMEDRAAQRAEIARRKATRRERCELGIGTAVAITEGPFRGTRGTIERVKRHNAVVHLQGGRSVTVGAWLLRPDDADGLQPVTGTAA